MPTLDSYGVASEVLTFALDCLNVAGRCDGLRTFVSPGLASYDCDQLTARIYTLRTDQQNQCITTYSVGVELQLVRCCIPVGTADSPPSMVDIDNAAKCVYDDMDTIYQCIICNKCDIAGNVSTISCDCLDVQNVEFDTAPSGTCIGARLKVLVQKSVDCC